MALPANAYANLSLVPPAAKTAAGRRTEADLVKRAETRIKRKIEQANGVLNKLELRTAAYSALIKELQRRKAIDCGRIERLEDRIITEMQAAELPTAAGIRCTFSVRAAAASLVIDDEAAVPAEYIRAKTAYSVDKVAIKSALAAGEDVAGVHLAQRISLIRK